MAVNTFNLFLAFCVCMATCAAPVAASAQCHDDMIEIKHRDNPDHTVSILLTTRRTSEVTVRLSFERLINLKPSLPMPYTFTIRSEMKDREVVRCTPISNGKFWVDYRYKYTRGEISSKPTVNYVYRLPYASDKHFKCTQSYFGKKSHRAGMPDEYAVDLDMPENTPILAARGGTVIAYRSDSSCGGDDEKFDDCANYVVIKHDDGTYGAYVHLTPGGVSVHLGQKVTPGTQIGNAGHTGWASGPHLHFMVYRVGDPPRMSSIPFYMSTPSGTYAKLEEGKFY